MSSIYSLLKRGKVNLLADNAPSEMQRQFETLFGIATKHECNCVLVKAQSILDDFILDAPDGKVGWPQGLNLLLALPMMPPYRNMWIEGTRKDIGRLAVQCRREEQDINGQTLIHFYPWFEYEGKAGGPLGRATFTLDKAGVALKACEVVLYIGDVLELVAHAAYVGMLAMAKLNCKNIELRMVVEPKVRRQRPIEALCSRWHEIKCTDTEKSISCGSAAFHDEGDYREVRLHWVRGHFKDYRHGKGHFGNSNRKYVLWIAEHQSGNAALGEVIPEYKLC